MASPTIVAARAVLRDADGPLPLSELTRRVRERVNITTAKPEQTVRNALQNDEQCVSDGKGNWVFLPTFVHGAAMRSPVRLASPETGELVIGVELLPLLWPIRGESRTPRPARLALEGGPTVRVGWSRKNAYRTGYGDGIGAIVKLPDPFWSWWGQQQADGANTLVIRCEDGEAGRYTCQAVSSPTLSYEEALEAHRPLQDAAQKAIGRSRAMWLTELASRLIATGLYHQADPNDLPPSFLPGLMVPLGRFILGMSGMIEPGSDLSPRIARLLGYRLVSPWYVSEEQLREALALPVAPPPPVAPPAEPPATTPPAGARFKVRLAWQPDVWRRIELRSDQTLEDLHDAIQDAFGWDDAHLYAFFLSGVAWDEVTQISRPIDPADPPPTAADVEIAALELTPGRRFLYVFDFGDDLRHEIIYEGSFPLDDAAGTRFPRVTEHHGEAPDQYNLDEEDDWPFEDDEDSSDEEGPIEAEAVIAAAFGDGPGLELLPAALLDQIRAIEASGGQFDPMILADGGPFNLVSLVVPSLNRFDFPRVDPRLRPLPVNLDQLASAFLAPDGTEFYLDLETGYLAWINDEADDPDAPRLRAAIAADPLRFARVPSEDDTPALRDMEDFIATVSDAELQARLTRAVASTRPQRRFFDALAHTPEEQQRWMDFSDRRRAERIVAWLASRGIAPDLPRHQR